MRARGINLQQFLLGLALVAALLWNLVHASEINGLQLSAGPTGTRAEIRLDAPGEYRVLRLTGPDRLVVDLPGGRFAKDLALPPGSGVVKSVRTGQPVPGTARLVFDMASPVVALGPRLETGADGVRLVLEWPDDGPSAPVAAAASAVQPPAPAPATTTAQAGSTQDPAAGDDPIGRVIAELQGRSTAATAATAPEQSSVASPQPASTQPQVAGMEAAGASVPPQGAGETPAAPPRVADAKPAAAADAPGGPATAPDAARPAAQPVPPRAVAGARPLVIAIDAGHGGQDPGAIGPGGTQEKLVTLAIARELARQINATPGMQAYLVRDRDVYIELPQRARKARQARADMFISIHADAAQNRNARGASVYTLSTRGASSQQARWLADRENASDLVGGVRLERDMLSNVLLDLAQSGHMKASQDAARHVLAGLRDLGGLHKRDVEYANFSVLRNADMPAMLVETGFISNVEEEKLLRDPAYQRRVAAAVLRGINEFFLNQPPPGTLYAMRAAASQAGSNAGSR